MSTISATPGPDPGALADVGFDRDLLAAMGPPISGPTATGSDARRFWRLAWTLAITDFKLRFFGSALGYLWQLVRPLMLFGVIYTVFSLLLKVQQGPHYPVFLLLGIVLYTFFSEITAGSVRCLVNREPLVRKIDFPRLAVPVSVLIGALMNVGLNLIPVFVFALAGGVTPTLSWLELPIVIAWIALFGFGIGMLLSSLFVRYRDIEPIWEVVLQAMFYASGVFFSLDTLGGKKFLGATFSEHDLSTGVMSNPFAAALQQARHAVVAPSYKSAAVSIGGWDYMMIPLGITVFLIVAGFLVFRRIAPTIAEEL